jgi:hypothetical protein
VRSDNSIRTGPALQAICLLFIILIIVPVSSWIRV